MLHWVRTDRPAVRYCQRTLESSGEHRTRNAIGTVYRIVVRDELSERYAAAFEGMEMETKNGQTILTGEIIDQPHLHGILDSTNRLGLELLSVQCLPEGTQNEAASLTRISKEEC
jgi:hypothetical protein